jgi:hypothetical protein
MLKPGGALAGQAGTATNNYVERVGYVTGGGCAVKGRLLWMLGKDLQ